MKTLLALLVISMNQSGWAAEPSIGRLFHTAEERARLDTARLQSTATNSEKDTVFTLDGEVRRSSGKDSHWINGKPRDGRSGYGAAIGDSMDIRSGKTQIPLLNGTIEITPRRQ
jgi:hypothetical protein